jgi:recombination protein RecR
MKIARPLARLIEAFEKLPGIGPKTAERLAFYALRIPQTELDAFSEALSVIKKQTTLCSVCKNVTETDPCPICADSQRDKTLILVVEEPLDILVFEKTNKFHGTYHVLHGAINPLENIGPDELFINDLLKRVKRSGNGDPQIKEVIIATNPTMEGEATSMFLNKKLKTENPKLKITRLGMGIPQGADLGYADEETLTQAIAGRREL